MEKIPSNVQSLLSASKQINNHKQAVKELVYNALDADSTSIAIRINVQENKIQVIDNGCGVCEKDLKNIGQKHMTSKLVDLSTLQSAPNKYGFRGQSLANIISVSKTVKLISRHEKSEETWMKLFDYGKEKRPEEWTCRPSKGTTVEVTGFLYNSSIQNRSNDILNELQCIKTFLENVSLVHSNISVSLRDDSRNEIIFKMHKNRDIYQTFFTLYHIDKRDFQELKVEKNEYKVTGFLGKTDKEIGRHLIFLNGKLVCSRILHKIVNKNLSKNFKWGGRKKLKVQNINKDEECYLSETNIPFYFIFIKCPYKDYELSNSPKQSVLEFRDWNQIKSLLEKLIKFFNGDINLKNSINIEKSKSNREPEGDTRKQVKKIMEKILGSECKKPAISQMHNGIKGKQIKRKIKKPDKKTISKAASVIKKRDDNLCVGVTNEETIVNNTITNDKSNKIKMVSNIKVVNANRNQTKIKYPKSKITTTCIGASCGKSYNFNYKKVSNNNDNKQKNNETKNKIMVRNNIIRKFELETESVKKRCQEIDKRTKDFLNKRNKRKCEVFVNENVQYDTIIKNNFKYTIRKQIDEIIIHDYLPRAPICKVANKNKFNNAVNAFQSNYDLLQTILKSQHDNNIERQKVDKPESPDVVMKPLRSRNDIDTITYRIPEESLETFQSHNSLEPAVTYQSHNYYARPKDANQYFHQDNYCAERIDNINCKILRKRPMTFITKQSRDNFGVPNSTHKHSTFKNKTKVSGNVKQLKSKIKRLFKQTSELFHLKNQIMANAGELSTSHTIEFTKSNYNCVDLNPTVMSIQDPSIDVQESLPQLGSDVHDVCIKDVNNVVDTYTTSLTDMMKNYDYNICSTYTIEPHSAERTTNAQTDDYQLNSKNYIFISKSQEYDKNDHESLDHDQNQHVLDPRNVCEVVLQSQDIINEEFEHSFKKRQINLSKNGETADSVNQIHVDDPREINNSLHNSSQAFEQEPNNHIAIDQNQEENKHNQNDCTEVSHHFCIPDSNLEINVHGKQSAIHNIRNTVDKHAIENQYVFESNNINAKISNLGDFNFKNRPCFLPKGMSPIFENCHTKNACEYNLSTDYYEDEMYNNFAVNVRNNADIFKPVMKEAKELTSNAIDKANAKINKDKATLKFNGQSLKEAKILGQIDEKFIATIMKGGNIDEITNFLVLFDQHAVHERIRLENNLSEYIKENQWKPVNIDEIVLKMSNDHILYLHNYKDKFTQFGLQWTVLNSEEVCFAAIPEAILGKNLRQVDKVMRAVKNLITEEIKIIKVQGGCVSLYPKSIMDLVFSEACRYAIKFGDKLSMSDCVELLQKLSNCKTPFQCAHGRPVMAVIMDINICKTDYKINLNKVKEWKKNNK